MKLKFTPLFTLLVTLGALPGAVLAASITWEDITLPLETGNVSDIITSGTFVDSASWTADDQIVNGVRFNGQTPFNSETGTMRFGHDSKITVTNIAHPNDHYGPGPTFSAGSYFNLVSGGAWQLSGFNTAINLGGLSVGQSYQVQIFEAFWDYNWDTSFGGSAPLQLGVSNDPDPKKTIPNYVVGTFTADAPTQLISLASDSGVVVFDAVQVRTTSVPDSGTTAALLGTALLGLAALRRRFGCA